MKNFFVYYGDHIACRSAVYKKMKEKGIEGEISSHKIDEPDMERLTALRYGGSIFGNTMTTLILDRYSIDSQVVSFLETFVKDMDDSVCVIVILNDVEGKLANRIKKVGSLGLVSHEAPLKNESAAASFVVNRSKKKGMNMPLSVASFFVGYVGMDIQNLIDEIDKLSLFCKEPSRSDIVKYVCPLSKDADILVIYNMINNGERSIDNRYSEKELILMVPVIMKICSLSLKGGSSNFKEFKENLTNSLPMKVEKKYNFGEVKQKKPSKVSAYICKVCWSVIRRVKEDHNEFFVSVYKRAHRSLIMSRNGGKEMSYKYIQDCFESLIDGEIVWVQ